MERNRGCRSPETSSPCYLVLFSGPHPLRPSAPVTSWVLSACSLSTVTEEEPDVRALFRCEKVGQRCGARLSPPSGPWQHTLLSQSFPLLAGSVRTFFDSSLTAFKELTHQTWFQFSFFPSHPCSITFTTNFCLFCGQCPCLIPQANMLEIIFLFYLFEICPAFFLPPCMLSLSLSLSLCIFFFFSPNLQRQTLY